MHIFLCIWMSTFITQFSAPGGNTVWISNSSVASSTYANSLRYIPIRHSQSDFVEFQFIPSTTAIVQLQIGYAMSSATASDIRLRLDTLSVASGGDPTTSLTTGTAFTISASNDVLTHTLTSASSSNLALSVTAGSVFYGKFIRLGSDGADTHTGDMRILEIRML